MSKSKPCPNCGYIRTQQDRHIHTGICPSCSIAYAKWQPTQNRSEIKNHEEQEFTVREQRSAISKILEFLLYTPTQVDSLAFYGRAILLVLFALWGSYFILGGVDWERIGGSFLHNVNLPFHEFGHVLFSPFGHFMMLLGGSLFQIMMPIIALIGFSYQMRDNFAAAIMLWWTGQNFIDVAPYIADAKARSLPLILGLSDDYHDWGNLLTQVNCLDCAPALANTSFFIGSCLIVLSLLWAVILLKKQKASLNNDMA